MNASFEAPECTEKRKARFIQGDRPEAGANLSMTARENCGYFFPKSKMRPKAGGRRRKMWKASKDVWKPCNQLKSHKIAKALFGKAWSKTREFWRSLEKDLKGAFIPPPLAPATSGLRSSWIVIARREVAKQPGVAFIRKRRSNEAVRPAKGGLTDAKAEGPFHPRGPAGGRCGTGNDWERRRNGNSRSTSPSRSRVISFWAPPALAPPQERTPSAPH
jgi:hypothetical protein